MLKRELLNVENENGKVPMKMNLQLFAAGAADDGTGDEGSEDDSDDDDDDDGDEDGKKSKSDSKSANEKTFTQKQVNAMMSTEKKQGRRALLKELGFKNEKEAKSALEQYLKYVESQKTDDQKQADAKNKENDAILEAERKANIAEAKVSALSMGCKKECVDDMVALVMGKLSDDNDDVQALMTEMKTKYPSMFESGKEDDDDKSKAGKRGTGTTRKQTKADPKKDESLGKRLATKKVATTSTKKSIWSK